MRVPTGKVPTTPPPGAPLFRSTRLPPAVRLTLAILLPLAILLALLCWRVWDLGVTHTDDAHWVLRSYTGFFQAGHDWAMWQGRLWAYVAGALIMLALTFQDTVVGELLRLGSFVLFFIAFHAAVAAYCTRRVALLSATLFVAFFALKWDGSILTTYPLITWPAGIACAGALLLGRAYTFAPRGHWQLPVAAVLQLFALFNNEGVTVTCIALALLSARANLRQGGDPLRARRLLLVFVGVAGLYAALYLGWRWLHPSIYGGNTLAPFDARRILTTLVHFSSSGSVLHEWFAPLSMPYADPFAGGGGRIVYAPQHYWDGLFVQKRAMFAGALCAWLLWRLMRHGAAPAGVTATSGASSQARLQPSPDTAATPPAALVRAVLGGLVLAVLPILPVALVVNYQQWAMEQQVSAYSHTVLAHFGWSLVLAAVLAALAGWCRQRRIPATVCTAALLALAGAAGLLAALAFRASDAIALDMRPEAGRWGVVNRAALADRALFGTAVLWAPGLAARTPYNQLHEQYWSEYVKARQGRTLDITTRIPDINDLVHGVVMLDYGYDAAARRMVALMMQYRKEGLHGDYRGGRIAVDLQGVGPRAARAYTLSFRRAGVPVSIAVATLAQVAGRPGLYLLDGAADIDPASVQLIRQGATAALCTIRLPKGVRIDMRTPRMANPAVDPRTLLGNGWHAADGTGVWSHSGAVRLNVPAALVPPGALMLELDVGSYTSIGFHKGTQRMAASVAGVALGQWDFPFGSTPTVRAALPAAAPPPAAADLALDLQVGPGFSPRQLGTGTEEDLGVRLRSVMLLPAP